MYSWGEGLGLLLTAVLFFWTAYHVLLALRGFTSPRPGAFDPKSLRNPVDLPFVSIVIPAKNAAAVVEDAVAQALGFTYPEDRKPGVVP